MRKLGMILLVILALSAMAAPVWAEESHVCEHDGTTIESLHHCITHAAEMGHVTNPGVANSLLRKVEAAHAALDRGQPEVAAEVLGAFISEVRAQSGKHIAPEHAGHLIRHAEGVIAALGL